MNTIYLSKDAKRNLKRKKQAEQLEQDHQERLEKACKRLNVAFDNNITPVKQLAVLELYYINLQELKLELTSKYGDTRELSRIDTETRDTIEQICKIKVSAQAFES
jgi:hypothetical protein